MVSSAAPVPIRVIEACHRHSRREETEYAAVFTLDEPVLIVRISDELDFRIVTVPGSIAVKWLGGVRVDTSVRWKLSSF
jgi:hypothetical protein